MSSAYWLWPVRATDSGEKHFGGTDDSSQLHEIAAFCISHGSASYVPGLNSRPGLTELLVSREGKDIQAMLCPEQRSSQGGPLASPGIGGGLPGGGDT